MLQLSSRPVGTRLSLVLVLTTGAAFVSVGNFGTDQRTDRVTFSPAGRSATTATVRRYFVRRMARPESAGRRPLPNPLAGRSWSSTVTHITRGSPASPAPGIQARS